MKRQMILLTTLPLLFSCVPTGSEIDNSLNVTLVDGEHFTAETSSFKVKPATDVTFKLFIETGFVYSGCDYRGITETIPFEDSFLLTLKNVTYSARIHVDVELVDSFIKYEANGGYLTEDPNKTSSVVFYSHESHLRINTEIDDGTFTRNGYELIGWNTKSDYTGEHIGLGSRVTLNDYLTLYAEWRKWTDVSSFTYTDVEGGIALTGCTSEDTTLVIPSVIDGKMVTTISRGFLSDKVLDEIVIPDSVITVETRGFSHCTFKEFYMYDTMMNVGTPSFSSCEFGTYHLNAKQPPRYSKDNDICQWSEVVDSIMLAKDEKKLICYGGCSFGYGLNSKMLEEAFDNEYKVLNLGVIGSTNADLQLRNILPYIGKDDVFLHAPEQMSYYQLMRWVDAETRMFVMCEQNYDLLSDSDISLYTSFFSCYSSYNKARMSAEPTSYTDKLQTFDSYGDISFYREWGGKQDFEDFAKYFDYEIITDESLERLDKWYQDIADQGATCYFTYTPINRYGLSDEEKKEESWKIEDKLLREGLKNTTFISDIENYIYSYELFYDTNYHCTSAGAEKRTKSLIEDLKTVL